MLTMLAWNRNRLNCIKIMANQLYNWETIRQSKRVCLKLGEVQMMQSIACNQHNFSDQTYPNPRHPHADHSIFNVPNCKEKYNSKLQKH